MTSIPFVNRSHTQLALELTDSRVLPASLKYGVRSLPRNGMRRQ